VNCYSKKNTIKKLGYIMAHSNNSVLVVDSLVKTFKQKKLFGVQKEFIAVNGISFSLQEGEILGFLGPNGAGKTTTIQILLSLMTPTSGTITYFGKNFFQHRSEILQHVAFASAYTKLPGRLTIFENLDIYGRLFGLPTEIRKIKIKDFLSFFGMWGIRDKPAGLLSAGQTTRVMLAKAFLADPKIVLLDEPTASLDPDVAFDVRNFVVQQQKERKISVLFTSHNMAEVEEICDRVLILKNGSIIANNTPDEIASSISKTRVSLMIGKDGLARAEKLAQDLNLFYTSSEHFIEIHIDERDVAQLLVKLAQKEVDYSQISIDKPTLQDYFLHIAKQ
jgi:ABC-2 type transport system ATP-binding protein